MHKPGRPEDSESIPRNYLFADFPHQLLFDWAQSTLNLKGIRLFGREADSLIRPATLKARYSEQEAEAFERELSSALYEIGDISGGPFKEIRDDLTGVFQPHGFRPFDLSLSCAHMGNPGAEAVSSSPSNIVKLHGEKFSTDFFTLGLIEHIKKTNLEPSANALQLEIPGHYDTGHIKQLNDRLAGLSGYDYTSRIIRPTLSMALQSAIARFSNAHRLKATITVTAEKGPNGGFILVISKPAHPIVLVEGQEDSIPGIGRLQYPSNHYMVKELFSTPDTAA